MKRSTLKSSQCDAQGNRVQQGRVAQKLKVNGIAAAVTMAVCLAVPPSYASDIEIYKVPEDSVGATTLMMMLDLSGSMGPDSGLGYSFRDYGITSSCNQTPANGNTLTAFTSKKNYYVDSTATPTYRRNFCHIATSDATTDISANCERVTTGYRCYDRLTRLKDGLYQALQGTATVPRVDDKIIMGLSTFTGDNGYVRVPARALSFVTGQQQVQVTKTRIVYDTVPVYETQQESYVVTPAVPGYDRSYWRRKTTTSGGTIYRYQTCNWSATSKTCSWPSSSSWSSSSPSGFTATYNTKACPSGSNYNYNCREYYVEVPEVPAVMGTRPIQVQVGTQQVPREETYTEMETRNVTQRDLLLTTISGLASGGGTPTAFAYADAAAYLMGTTTSNSSTLQAYFVSTQSGYANYYRRCIGWSGDTCTTWLPSGNTWYTGFSAPSGYTIGASGNLGLSGNYYIGRSPFSGFAASVSTSKNATTYNAPSSISDQVGNADKKECSGQGIYFLTDGEPNHGGIATGSTGTTGTAYDLMKLALGTSGSTFTCANSPLGNRGTYANAIPNWACIGNFSKALLDPGQNQMGLQFKTVIVGFGSTFGVEGATGSNDVEDAKTWGTLGGSKLVPGTKPEDVSNSINDFIGELVKDIPSMSTGSSTIPLDALNPSVVQPFSYFPQFEPKVRPEDTQQVWFGNLKKYHVLNNGIYASKTATPANQVVKNNQVQDVSDIWAKAGVTYQENTPVFVKGGALSQLPVGMSTDNTTANRKLLTDYKFDGSQSAGNEVSQDLGLVQVNYNYTTNANTRTDTTYAKALMGLLGYNIASDVNTNGLDLTAATASLRQMGSIAHSNPILLTQEGKAVATESNGVVTVGSEGRKDYVLFGTSQGLVQVVDAETGIEKFAYVPKEIIQRQSETFKNNGGNLSGGKNALYYGMDGEWSAHTVYVTKSDGTLTVKGTGRKVVDETDEENLQGKQWVYGGMRMGGRSYYALDLTDIENPKIKFQIDPSTGKVYSADHPTGTAFAAISKMGQSWSKPKLDYVNWKGKRKLVMFVGGGYDAGGEYGDGLYTNGVRTGYAGYETYNYMQETSKDQNNVEKQIGAGVYMFDADNGDLLWNADSTTNPALKYSVVSEIKTVDRNNDGVVDHLYFGDLAGQAFRVDFKNDGASTFAAQATRVLNLHQTDGTSPRFYTVPVFTAHRSAGKVEGGNIVLAIFASGNKSSPLLGSTNSPQKRDTVGLQYDGVYAVYDYDIYPQGSYYPTSNLAARTLAATTATAADNTKLKYINDAIDSELTGATRGALIDKTTGWGGWYYLLNKKFNGNAASGGSIIKALNNMIALEGNLYVTQYDSSDNGTTSSCGAGVLGNSFAKRICLPTGVCNEEASYTYNLGSGIVALNVGGGPGPDQRQLVVPDPLNVCVGTTCSTCVGDDCDGKKFIPAGGPLRFIPNRWYEKYAKVS